MIPLGKDDFVFPTGLSTALILMQVEYAAKVKHFEDTMQDVLKRLKKEGFDDRAMAVAAMEDVDKRIADGKEVSEEERKKADETRSTLHDYRAEYDELNKQWMEARIKKGEDEVPGFNPKLTKDEYKQLVETIGIVGDIELDGVSNPIPKTAFLRMLAEHFV